LFVPTAVSFLPTSILSATKAVWFHPMAVSLHPARLSSVSAVVLFVPAAR
jgi:hypothetical protein